MDEFQIPDIKLPELPKIEPFDSSSLKLDTIKKDIQVKSGLKFTDKFLLKNSGFNRHIEDKRVKFTEFDVRTEDVFTKSRNGQYTPKFENHIAGINNEDLLAQKQSSWNQIVNGLTKFAGKTGLSLLDGTVGTVTGLVEGIRDGQLSSIYNNSFSKWIDSAHQSLDYMLPNYYTDEQKNKGFLESLATVNFWANDVTQGLSFTAGMLLSEGVWAYGTGGSSLAGFSARNSLKLSRLGNTLNKSNNAAFVAKSRDLYKTYLRTIPKSETARNLNNLRFLYTSSAFEAGVEARHSLNESVENYIHSYEKVHGRKPNKAEMSEFMDSAITAANGVFGANVGLVGSSNILMFGGLFDISTQLRNTTGRAFSRAFGQGIVKKEGVAKALKPNKFQTLSGGLLNVLKAPILEGVIEEGGQSVISKTSQNWLASRFHPDAAKKNLSVIQSSYDAFKKTYGTKEGRKEIGIGMIIGGVSRIGNFTNGTWTPLGIGEFSQRQKLNETLGEEFNKSTNRLNNAQINLIERLAATNQMNTYIESSESKIQEGDYSGATRDWDIANFTKFMIDDKAGLLNETEKDFEYLINNTNQNYDLSKNDFEKLKTNLKDDFARNLKLYKNAKRAAKGIDLTVENKDYTDQLAFNIYMGSKSSDRMDHLLDLIGDYTLNNENTSVFKIYSLLSDKTQKNIDELIVLESDLKALESQYSSIQNDITSERDEVFSKQKAETKVEQLNETQDQSDSLRSEIITKRNKIDDLKSKISLIPINSKALNEGLELENSLQSLESFTQELSKLEGYFEALKGENPAAYNEVNSLFQEYNSAVRDFFTFNAAYLNLTDPRTISNFNGVLNKIKTGVKIPDEFLQNTDFDLETQELDKKLTNSNLTENQKVTIRLLHRLDTAFRADVTIESTNKQGLEVISNSDYDNYVRTGEISETITNNIVDKIVGDSSLSNRESEIFINNRALFDPLIDERKYQIGDSPLPQRPLPERGDSLLERLKSKVDLTVSKSKYLEGFEVDNVNKSTKPTTDDFDNFESLTTIEHSEFGYLTMEETEELNELTKKLNNWGKLQGTLVDEENLSDIIEQIVVLETYKSARNESVTGVKPVEIYNTVEFKKGGKNNNFDYMQSYENALVSQNLEGYFKIHNTSIDGVISIINNVARVTKNKKTNLGRPKVGDIYKVEIDGEFINLEITEGNNIQLSSRGREFLNKLTPLKIFPDDSLPTNYQPLYKQVVDITGDNKLIPVESDFTFYNDEVVDNEAVSKLKKDDDLALEVDLRDDFNKRLIEKVKKTNLIITEDNYRKVLKTGMKVEDKNGNKYILSDKVPYKKSKGKVAFGLVRLNTTDLTLPLDYETWIRKGFKVTGLEINDSVNKEIAQGLVIKLRDRRGSLVGVLKRLDDVEKTSNDVNRQTLVRIRNLAVNRIMDQGLTEGVVDLDIETKVKKLHFGHPNINYKEEGGKFTPIMYKPTNATDIGYLENGILKLKNKTKVSKYPYLTNLESNPYYRNKKVPVVVFKHNGLNVAYPATLKQKEVNAVEIFDQLLSRSLSNTDLIIETNKLIIDSGLDVNTIGLTSDSLNEENLNVIRDQLGKVKGYANVLDWFGDLSLENTLDDIMVNINTNDKPFHSPKVRLALTDSVDKLTEELILPKKFDGDKMPEVKKEVEKIKKTC